MSLTLAALGAALAAPCDGFGALRDATPAAPGLTEGPPCLAWNLEVAGQLEGTRPTLGLSRQLTLPRSRLELGLRGGGPASARLAVEGVRSGGVSGYVGLDGESIVSRIQIAEARVDLTRFGLAAAAGVVDDPWVIAGQQSWGLPGVRLPLATDQGWMERADLGLWVAWTAPRELATLTLSSTSGEGYRRRERNDGQDVGAMLRLRPLALAGLPPDLLVVSGFARSGSRGLSYARNHRAGLRVSAEHAFVAGGAELLLAWGVEGDATREPLGVSAWARTGPALPVVGWVRVDQALAARGDPESAVTALMVGAGPTFAAPDGLFPGQAHLVLGYRGQRVGEDAAALAGAAELASSHTVFLQLSSQLRGLMPLDPS